MYEKRNKFIVSVLLLSVLTISIFSPTASAVFYEGSFPYAETGLTGGGYIECSSSIGDIVIVFPVQYIDNYLTFTTSGNLFNVSNTTISCILFRNGTQYQARFQSFGTLQYRLQSGAYYEYTDIITGNISDTNVDFTTSSERINDNYYFDKFQIAVLSVLIAILFFNFLGWFLWHKR